MTQKTNRWMRAAGLALVLAAPSAAVGATEAAAPAPAPAAAEPAVFARVGGTVITHDEYQQAFAAATRAKFYHGKPPAAEIAVLQREVSDQIVARVLLLREAGERGLKPDQEQVDKTVAGYDARYAASAAWKENRARMVAPLIVRLGEDSVLTQLEKRVRAASVPSDEQVRAYYAAHPEQFTEPEQLRVSVILLKVEPSAPTSTWVKIDEQAQELARRARAGEDFAALARAHSADPSATSGGDMGYLHGGMLPEAAQSVIGALKVGESTESLRLLQGLAVFRLTGRKPARLHGYEAVQGRARELAQREQGEQAWTGLIAALRARTPAQVDASRFLPLAEAAGAQAAPK